MERQNPYLDYLVDPSFQGVNRCKFYHLKIIHTEQDKEYILLCYDR